MKRRVPKPLLIVLLVVVLAYPAFQVFLFGYTGLRMLIASQETHEVVYKVTGTAKQPDISYVRDGHQDSADVKRAALPWESQKLKTKGSSQLFSVSALQQLDDNGSTRCEIWMDGKLVDSKDSAATGLSVHCMYLP
ncbi:MmpS family transport accessory protein [Kribbella sp. NPDC051587]|uniref:MmpS family transport accessory protein n=1 Tax=Kribbella sp. NPDC051587 TaxID=3364119 RepID=UPI0037AAD03F